jgi:predicted ATP-dependent endonuclease of OLD family
MSTITIRNIGPIIDVTLELNKVTVIMGPQSSGKSTIAKIISFCQWLEKRYVLDREFNETSIHLKDFHRISDTYFNENSFIEYKGSSIEYVYGGKYQEPYLTIIKEGDYFINCKNSYIPAERNFVSVIPNLGKYKDTNDNIMNFLYDWYEAKKKYTNDNQYSILDLNVSYYHKEEKDIDILVLNDSKKELLLNCASSGLQSVIPMLIMIDYLTLDSVFEKVNNSVDEKKQIKDDLYLYYSQLVDNGKSDIDFNTEMSTKLLTLFRSRAQYHFSRFIIEEPEQNLFPETQRDLVYFMLEKMNNSGRNHELLLTTHSPYILYALNNCMLGYLVKDTMPQDEQQKLTSKKAWIDPQSVSIWEIENGKIKSIQGEDGLIENNYFDRAMKNVMDDFYAMLNYYGDEE